VARIPRTVAKAVRGFGDTFHFHELHEAYGMTAEEYAAVIARMDQQRDDGEHIDYPELSDGYSYQSNSTDSGIVETGDMTLEERGEEYHQLRFKVVLG
jgi:hypothetical protein